MERAADGVKFYIKYRRVPWEREEVGPDDGVRRAEADEGSAYLSFGF